MSSPSCTGCGDIYPHGGLVDGRCPLCIQGIPVVDRGRDDPTLPDEFLPIYEALVQEYRSL